MRKGFSFGMDQEISSSCHSFASGWGLNQNLGLWRSSLLGSPNEVPRNQVTHRFAWVVARHGLPPPTQVTEHMKPCREGRELEKPEEKRTREINVSPDRRIKIRGRSYAYATIAPKPQLPHEAQTPRANLHRALWASRHLHSARQVGKLDRRLAGVRVLIIKLKLSEG